MAKSKASTKSDKALVKSQSATEAPLTTKVSNGSPYQLDPAQVERAATALVAHMKKHAQTKEEESNKKSLLAGDEDEPEQNDAAIFLTLATKQHIKDDKRLKPNKITLPHSIQAPGAKLCLIVKDPQREYKNIVAGEAFPQDVRAKIGRVIGVEKLKKKYKTYETKRQLLAEYDVFLADDRIMESLPKLLGNVFYKGKGKRPLPISLAQQVPKDKDNKRARIARKPQEIAQEIESTLNSTHVNLSSSATTAIKIGKLSQTPEQLQENIEATVSALISKFVPQGWKNVRGLHIKGPATMALPIWLADELWADDSKVLEEPWKPAIKDSSNVSEKKRKWAEWEEEMLDDEDLAERREKASKKTKKSKSKGESAAKDLGTISKERRKKLKQDALKSVQTPLIAGS